MRGQQLLLQAPDRQHFPAQRDLACHRHIRAHRDLGERRDQCGAHADAGARAVLRRSPFRDVQVHVLLLVELGLEPQPLRAAAHHGHGGLDRLLHHLTELAGVLQLALAGHDRGLDGEQFPAHLGPREPRDLADAVHVLGLAVAEAAHAQELVEIARRDRDRLLLLLVQQHLLHGLAADLGDLALEVAHARFARVVTHDVEQRRIGHLQLLELQSVMLLLFRHEITARDVHLLVFGVAGQTDDFHAVEQRRRDVEGVRRAHEHHLGEVQIDLEVMIVEGGVLLGVQHLEQRRGGIAAEIHGHLVDFIEQEQRVVHGRLRHVLHDLAGHGTDVGAPVTTDLGLIAHAP